MRIGPRSLVAGLTASAAILAGCGGSTPARTTTIASAVVSAPTQSAASSAPDLTVPAPKPEPRRHANAQAGAVKLRRAAPTKPLAGRIVGIDPGHNGRNYSDPDFINHLIWNGREQETCDTTGTETDGGYAEAQFNWNVAGYLAADLRAQGAKVVLTRSSNGGVGPCVTTRSQIIDRAHANVAIDIHADGAPASGHGFAILVPVADGPNDKVIGSSLAFAKILRTRYVAVTGMPVSNYDGVDGIEARDDLAGLNLTTVPKVLIENGNMRNAGDAALQVTSHYQQLAAKAMDEAIVQFLTAR
jgi:N-acetylmuramoyl-L-alanine amidase